MHVLKHNNKEEIGREKLETKFECYPKLCSGPVKYKQNVECVYTPQSCVGVSCQFKSKVSIKLNVSPEH